MTRAHHVGNVRHLHPVADPVAVNPRHPSLYDHEAEPDAPVAGVRLTLVEAHLIAGLLRTLRNHAPSPRAVDEAIQLLEVPK